MSPENKERVNRDFRRFLVALLKRQGGRVVMSREEFDAAPDTVTIAEDDIFDLRNGKVTAWVS